FLCWLCVPRDLPPCPTRRSSDLRHVAANWRAPYALPQNARGVLLRGNGIAAGPDGAPILVSPPARWIPSETKQAGPKGEFDVFRDRKSTRLNSSHVKISYAVFCL